jgi:hypothetical protein
MRHLQGRRNVETVLAFATALVVMLLLPLSASARPAESEWSLAGAKLTETVNIRVHGTTTINDTGSKLAIECEDSAEGTAATAGAGKLSHWTNANCKAAPGITQICSSHMSLEPQHLPWSTKLSTDGKRGALISLEGTGGEPAFKLKCGTVVGEESDECTVHVLDAHNTSSGGGAEWLGERAYCTAGKSGEAAKGTQAIEGANGSEIRAIGLNEANELWNTDWLVSGVKVSEPQAVTWNGTYALNVRIGSGEGAENGVECAGSGEGIVNENGYGEIKNWFSSSCVPAGGAHQICKSRMKLEPVDLPWKTELVKVEGKVRDVIVNGGHGAPGFTVSCSGIIGEVTDTCTGLDSAVVFNMANVTGGVSATPRSPEKLNCQEAGESRGTLSGSQTVSVKGHTLQVE